MNKKPDFLETIFTRKRLTDLKLRLDRVANAWTVDDYTALLDFYVKILPKVLDAERCTIYIIEMGTAKIFSIFGTGLRQKRIEPPREGSIAGQVISTGQGIIANDLDKRSGFHSQVALEDGFATRNMVCAPIKNLTGHGVSGAIQVLNRQHHNSFEAADLTLLEEFAGFLSISIESIILTQEILRISSQLNREVERFDRGYFHDTPFIAESPAMQDVLAMVRLISSSPVNVLIQGENGTGKELVARMIHLSSNRRQGPFVPVNCAAIPENLMESEFFGYEKGAFTGADSSRKGRFEEANNGTLLLDEIADMPLSMQPKFLRAIQEGEGSRLGSGKLIPYDLRIISATNKDLKEELRQGHFREDLFFRLFSVELRMPSLRERREDIVPLAFAFLDEVCARFKKKIAGISQEVLNVFEEYNWPGNVRQLRREIERLVTLTKNGEQIPLANCSQELLSFAGTANADRGPTDFSIPDQVQSLEIRLIEKALKKSGGNKARAAKLLGITRQGLHKKINRYQLDL